MQATGAEVVHLGHNRSVQEVVDTVLQEDAQGVAVSSYQGGHNEYFRYLRETLDAAGAGHVKIFGGGGGVIVPEEIAALREIGVTVFSPEDGMRMGLQGMINSMVEACDTDVTALPADDATSDALALARRLTRLDAPAHAAAPRIRHRRGRRWGRWRTGARSARATQTCALAPVVGITGTGGAGKSTLTDELLRRLLADFDDLRVAVLSVDPTRARTGGALLGDRIRMNALYGANAERVFMRSFATRQAHSATSAALASAIGECQRAGFDLVLVETAGIGQSDTLVTDVSDVTLYVMTGDYGAPSQLEKIGMLDAADLVALNKFEKRGAEDALRDVRKQVQRNRAAFDAPAASMPVYPTMASHFGDDGVTRLYLALLGKLREATGFARTSAPRPFLPRSPRRPARARRCRRAASATSPRSPRRAAPPATAAPPMPRPPASGATRPAPAPP